MRSLNILIIERAYSQSQAQPSSAARPPLTRHLTEAEEYARSVREKGESIQRRHSRHPSGLSESRPVASPDSPQSLRRRSSEAQPITPIIGPNNAVKAVETRRASQIRLSHPHRMSPSPEILGTMNSTVQGLSYPPDLPRFLDGMHHTDELATYFEAGWPTIEKWLVAIGSGQGNGDYGKVIIIYR